ncbi:NAD(P)-dependent oxidoreductase [Roseicyclus sp.]|uniref:NAD(P)-dependent oxidoreductase n=1 Tax=Roseicyclus sp. TaxID=1914329 RepID=UPI003FA0AE9A
MNILLLGATGRTGRLIAERLLAEGHAVRSLGRRDPGIGGLAFTKGEVTDAGDLCASLAGIDAVVSALASSNADPVCSRAAEALIVASGARALRFVTIGGAAVDAEGDAKGLADRAIGGIMKLVAGRMLADRQREYALLRASALDWTMLRPPRLTDAPATGSWRLSFDRPAGTQIARADLAAAAVEALGRADLSRRAPFVAGGRAA